MKFIRQSIIVAASFLFIFIWQQTPASQYTIQAIGFFILVILVVSLRKKGTKPFDQITSDSLIGIFSLNTLVFLFIIANGGLNSGVFFLLYFLGFGISFVFEPGTVFVFLIGTVLLFIQPALSDDVLGHLLHLGSLGLLVPLAFFFGREFRDEQKAEQTIQTLQKSTKQEADVIANDAKKVISDRQNQLSKESKQKLENIIEETKTIEQNAQ